MKGVRDGEAVMPLLYNNLRLKSVNHQIPGGPRSEMSSQGQAMIMGFLKHPQIIYLTVAGMLSCHKLHFADIANEKMHVIVVYSKSKRKLK